MQKINLQTAEINNASTSHSLSYTKFQVTKVRWNRVDIDQFQKECQTKLDLLNRDENIPYLAQNFSSILVESAEKHSQKEITSLKSNVQHKPYFSKQYRSAH